MEDDLPRGPGVCACPESMQIELESALGVCLSAFSFRVFFFVCEIYPGSAASVLREEHIHRGSGACGLASRALLRILMVGS